MEAAAEQSTTLVPAEEEIITVIFTRSSQGDITGKVLQDCKRLPQTQEGYERAVQHAQRYSHGYDGNPFSDRDNNDYDYRRDEYLFRDYEDSDCDWHVPSISWEQIAPKIPRRKIVFVYGYRPERLPTWEGSLPQDYEVWTCKVVRDTKPQDPETGALLVKLVQNKTQKEKQDQERKRKLEAAEEAKLFDIQKQKEREERERLRRRYQRILKFFTFTEIDIMYGKDIILAECIISLSREIKQNRLKALYTSALKELSPTMLHDKASISTRVDILFRDDWKTCISVALDLLTNKVEFSAMVQDHVDHTVATSSHEAETSQFEFTGQRYFLCPCGFSNRVGKSLYRNTPSGEKINISCECCGQPGYGIKP